MWNYVKTLPPNADDGKIVLAGTTSISQITYNNSSLLNPLDIPLVLGDIVTCSINNNASNGTLQIVFKPTKK